jgi:hypothetical protein
LERAAEEPTGATGEACAPKCTDRCSLSNVPFRTRRPPQKRSRFWMHNFPGCEVQACPILGGGGDLLRFFGPMIEKSAPYQRHHRVSFLATDRGGRRGTATFSSPQELAALAAKWPGHGWLRSVTAWCGTSRAVYQPAGGRHSDWEGHSEPAARRWCTAAAGGAEEGECEEQGQPPRGGALPVLRH